MTLPATLCLLAVFTQVCLTLWAIVRMGLARVASVKSGEVRIAEIALSDRAWPEPIQKLQANVRNQFETPVLFFAGIAIAIGLDATNWSVAIFAWMYVATRIVHHVIHVGSNSVGKRFRAYVIGLAALLALWLAVLAGAFLS